MTRSVIAPRYAVNKICMHTYSLTYTLTFSSFLGWILSKHENEYVYEWIDTKRAISNARHKRSYGIEYVWVRVSQNLLYNIALPDYLPLEIFIDTYYNHLIL